MPRIDTRFGSLDYEEDAVVEFPAGLPGFADERRFLLIEQPAHRPLAFLQSVTRPELCFVTLPVRSIAADYQLKVSPEDLSLIGLDPAGHPVISEQVLCLAILCLRRDQPPTANLLGPVVINRVARRAVQAVRDDMVYSAYYPLGAVEEPCS